MHSHEFHTYDQCVWINVHAKSGGCRLTGKFVKVRLHHISFWSVRSGKCYKIIKKPTKEPSRCWKMMKVMSPYCSFFVYSSSRVQIVRQSSKCSWIVIRAVVLQTLQRQDRRCMYVYVYIYRLCMVCIFMLQLELRIYDGAEIGRNWKKRL